MHPPNKPLGHVQLHAPCALMNNEPMLYEVEFQ